MSIRGIVRIAGFKIGKAAYKYDTTKKAYNSAAKALSKVFAGRIDNYLTGSTRQELADEVIAGKISARPKVIGDIFRTQITQLNDIHKVPQLMERYLLLITSIEKLNNGTMKDQLTLAIDQTMRGHQDFLKDVAAFKAYSYVQRVRSILSGDKDIIAKIADLHVVVKDMVKEGYKWEALDVFRTRMLLAFEIQDASQSILMRNRVKIDMIALGYDSDVIDKVIANVRENEKIQRSQ